MILLGTKTTTTVLEAKPVLSIILVTYHRFHPWLQIANDSHSQERSQATDIIVRTFIDVLMLEDQPLRQTKTGSWTASGQPVDWGGRERLIAGSKKVMNGWMWREIESSRWLKLTKALYGYQKKYVIVSTTNVHKSRKIFRTVNTAVGRIFTS